MKYTKNYKFKKPEPYDTRNINDINDSFDLVDAKLKETQDNNENLKATFEQLTINAGDSNAEIVAARRDNTAGTTFKSLPNRLDNFSSQLAQIENKKVNKDEVTNGMTPKGNIAYASLPTNGNTIGDYYYCPDGDGTNPAGNYAWNGSKWYFAGTGDSGYNLLDIDMSKNKEDAYGSYITTSVTLENKWVLYDGTEDTSTTWIRSAKISVDKFDKIKVSGMGSSVATKKVPPFLFKNASGNVIYFYPGATDGTYYTDLEVKVPSDATTLIINGNNTTKPPMLKYFIKENLKNKIETIENKIAKGYADDFYKYLYTKCICIGDSLTEGYRTEEIGVISDKSYPAYLQKLTQWVVTNAGKSGITTYGWFRDKFANYTYTEYDIAIINLGQNAGLTDTLDADVNAFSNWKDYAQTNTGGYCKIIEGMREQNPNIKIFIVKGQKDTITNRVIEKINEKYEFTTMLNVDDTTYFDLSKTMYHPSGYTVHYSTVGYLTLAKLLLLQINNYLSNNLENIYKNFEVYN